MGIRQSDLSDPGDAHSLCLVCGELGGGGARAVHRLKEGTGADTEWTVPECSET